MAAIILTWNPARWPWDDFDQDLEEVHRTGSMQGRWSVGRHTHTPAGADAYLYLQGQQHGLVAHAVVTSEAPFRAPHFSDPRRFINYVDLDFDAILPIADRVPRPLLEARVPEVPWHWLPQSGRPVPPAAEAALQQAWAEHAHQPQRT